MAADSMTTASGYVESKKVQKIFKLRSAKLECDVIIGIAGDRNSYKMIINHILNGTLPSKDDRESFDYDVIMITEDARCFEFGVNNPTLLEYQTPKSIGSGGMLSRGAMLAGASPKEAVEIAAEIDVYTGGEINVMSFED